MHHRSLHRSRHALPARGTQAAFEFTVASAVVRWFFARDKKGLWCSPLCGATFDLFRYYFGSVTDVTG
jgi:hypothetical protein